MTTATIEKAEEVMKCLQTNANEIKKVAWDVDAINELLIVIERGDKEAARDKAWNLFGRKEVDDCHGIYDMVTEWHFDPAWLDLLGRIWREWLEAKRLSEGEGIASIETIIPQMYAEDDKGVESKRTQVATLLDGLKRTTGEKEGLAMNVRKLDELIAAIASGADKGARRKKAWNLFGWEAGGHLKRDVWLMVAEPHFSPAWIHGLARLWREYLDAKRKTEGALIARLAEVMQELKEHDNEEE